MLSRVCFLLVYKAGVIIVPNMGGLGGQSSPSAGWCVSSKDYLLASLVTKSHLRDLFFSLSGRHIAYFSQMVGAVCVHIHMGVGVRCTCIYSVQRQVAKVSCPPGLLSALVVLFSLRQCLSLNMELVWDDWPMSSRDPPGSAPVPPIGGTVELWCPCQAFYMGDGDLNRSLHTCVVGILPTEPLPWHCCVFLTGHPAFQSGC